MESRPADLNVVLQAPKDPPFHIACARNHIKEFFVRSLQNIKLIVIESVDPNLRRRSWVATVRQHKLEMNNQGKSLYLVKGLQRLIQTRATPLLKTNHY
jgi:hypothetical protein